MRSEYFQKVLERLTGLKGLTADNFPNGPVTVTLRDGSAFIIYDAFCIHDKKKESVFVFSEHYGYHQFDDTLIILYSGPNKPLKRTRRKKI